MVGSFFETKKQKRLRKMDTVLNLKSNVINLEGGAYFDTRVKDWVEYIFEKDPNDLSVILVHADRLAVPEGLASYSTAEEVRLRSDTYNINELLKAYRTGKLCSPNSGFSSETLLHAHAEVFLSKGYAAWNLTGKSRLDFLDRLRRFTEPALATMFFENAPVCTLGDDEIIIASELKERVLQLERENVNFKAVAEEAADQLARVTDELTKSRDELSLLESSIAGAIEAGLEQKDRQLEQLQAETDVIVASALQEFKDTQRKTLRNEPEIIKNLQTYTASLELTHRKDEETIENLKTYAASLELTQKKLEAYLLTAKEALSDKLGETVLSGSQSSDSAPEMPKSILDVASFDDDDYVGASNPQPKLNYKRPPQTGCIVS
jgi:hypothetical protein